jgi:hypothetical protein
MIYSKVEMSGGTVRMDEREYEQLTRDIAEAVFKDAEACCPERVMHGRKSKIEGASGHPHQIDVAVYGSNSLLLVECKYWTETVPVDAVLTFAARRIDIQGVYTGGMYPAFVTTKGFQKGALKVGRYFGIQCHLVRSVNEFSLSYKGSLRFGFPGLQAKCQVGESQVVITDSDG